MVQEYKVLINPISKPLQIGIYKDNKLIESIDIDGYASDYLIEEIIKLLDIYNIKEFIYVNGPGSQMGIKLSYIALKSIEMIKGIRVKSCSAFELNGQNPLKAMGKLYFVKEKENIITKKLEIKAVAEFKLPKDLSTIKIDDNNLPDYRLPAV